MIKIIILVILLVLLFFSVRSKIFLNRQRQNDLPETINSPFSEAITQLLGIAGGIYLSMVMLSSFLNLEIPENVIIFAWRIDPLALISLLIALIQPLILRILRKVI